jgi:hypothetical protein
LNGAFFHVLLLLLENLSGTEDISTSIDRNHVELEWYTNMRNSSLSARNITVPCPKDSVLLLLQSKYLLRFTHYLVKP